MATEYGTVQPSLAPSEAPSEAVGGSPLDIILQTAGGYCVPRALHVVAEIGIADLIGGESCSVEELASVSGVNADALGRVLRLLAAHGLFSVSGNRVSHNEASRLLMSDHPQSARDLARMFGLPFFWETFEALEHTVRTGRPAVEKTHPSGLWAWLAEHPEAGLVFDGAMTGKSVGQVAGVVEAFDFSRFGRIADIGGGRGHLLHAILAKWPAAQGVLFDLPHVVAQTEIGSDRLQLRPGDFFTDQLPVADAYILMEVLHDWPDEEAGAILSAVARSAPRDSSLLLVEQLMPDSAGPHWVKMLDVHMMTLFAARQRSAAEYNRLAGGAGFEPAGCNETPAGITILEYRKL